MTEKAETAILTALFDHFSELEFDPVIPVAWPNKTFSPPTPSPTAKYFRVTAMPAETFGVAVSHSGSNRHAGLLQIDLFFGKETGERVASRIIDEVIEHFKRGTALEESGFKITVDVPPTRMPMAFDDKWAILTARVRYLCFAKNQE